MPFSYEDLRSSILIKVDRRHAGEHADIYLDGEIITKRVDSKGTTSIQKKVDKNDSKFLAFVRSDPRLLKRFNDL